jgi:hypothetical protein
MRRQTPYFLTIWKGDGSLFLQGECIFKKLGAFTFKELKPIFQRQWYQFYIHLSKEVVSRFKFKSKHLKTKIRMLTYK